MKESTIDSFAEFHNLLKDFKELKYIFRGQDNHIWPLLPKIGRPEFHKTISKGLNEESILESWARYAEHYLDKASLDKWNLMTLAQHYGLATRLLDWTRNPLVALYFATENVNEKCDGVVYILDFDNRVLVTDTKSPFEITISGVFIPTGLSARVISQRGVFTISNKPNKPFDELVDYFKFHRIIIPAKSKYEIQKCLELYGINEYSIYQDLDSLSKYLNRFIINNDTSRIK